MDGIALDLGFIQIYWYSITMLLAIAVGSLIAYYEVKKEKINVDFFYNLVFYTVIISIAGARLYYVLFNLSYYLDYPIEILEIWNGGLAIHGAILAGGAFIFYYCRKKKVNVLKIFDIVAPCLLIGQAIGRWGNFFNGEAHGRITTLITLKKMHLPDFIIKGMYIDGNYYQPTFLYESIWNLLGFIVLFILKKRKITKIGQTVCLYLMWYSVGRFFIEGLRTDSLMLGSVRIAQLISIVLFAVGLLGFIYLRKEKRIHKRNEVE